MSECSNKGNEDNAEEDGVLIFLIFFYKLNLQARVAEVVEVLVAAGLGKEVGTVLGAGTVHEDELVILI